MNFYKLDNDAMDKDFLEGKAVLCDAVLPASEYQKGKIKDGDRIVVLLSNGKKYMGFVVTSNFTVNNTHAFGKIEITRHQKS